jgi:hypothetical protein
VDAVLAHYATVRGATVTGGAPSSDDATTTASEAVRRIGDAIAQTVDDVVTDGFAALEQGAAAVAGGLTAAAGAIGDAVTSVLAPPNGSVMFAVAPRAATGTPQQFVWRKAAEIASPEIRDSLDFLTQAWPAARADAMARLAVLNTFFGRLGDPNAAFDKVAVGFGIAAGTLAGSAAGAAVGAVVGGVVGGVGGGILTSEIPGVTTWIGVAVGAGIGVATGGTIGAVVGGASGGVAGAIVGGAAGPAMAALVDGVLRPLGLAGVVPNDGGLRDAILALQAQYLAATTMLPFAGASSSAGDDSRAAERLAVRAYEELRTRAAAQVEYDRLACHLAENLYRYLPGLWADLRDYDVAAIAHDAGLPEGVVETRISGYVGPFGALRVTDREWAQRRSGVTWDELVSGLAAHETVAPTDTIRLPTPGLVVEPALGQCDGCEEFVTKHREHDLAYRAAEVALIQARAVQASVEATRFQTRLDAGVLGDPTPYEGDSVEVEVAPPGGD